MANFTVLAREDAHDYMAQYPGYGEMRFYTQGLGNEQVAFTWRSMPPGTGGKGSYGHRHKTQEEIYFVTRGKVLFKLEDEVIEAGPQTAVRVAPEVLRSVHNDGPDEAELIIFSIKIDDPAGDTETSPDFWPAN